MSSYVRAKRHDKGIEMLLAGSNIAYESLPELGNQFPDDEFSGDWQIRYQALLAAAGPLLMIRSDARLNSAHGLPLCLMCAERDPCRCHRMLIAAPEQRGLPVQHLGSD